LCCLQELDQVCSLALISAKDGQYEVCFSGFIHPLHVATFASSFMSKDDQFS
jgi:hypothetical protein